MNAQLRQVCSGLLIRVNETNLTIVQPVSVLDGLWILVTFP